MALAENNLRALPDSLGSCTKLELLDVASNGKPRARALAPGLLESLQSTAIAGHPAHTFVLICGLDASLKPSQTTTLEPPPRTTDDGIRLILLTTEDRYCSGNFFLCVCETRLAGLAELPESLGACVLLNEIILGAPRRPRPQSTAAKHEQETRGRVVLAHAGFGVTCHAGLLWLGAA